MLTSGCFAMMAGPASFMKRWYAELGPFFGLLSVELFACVIASFGTQAESSK